MERVTVCSGSVTISVDKNHIYLSYYHGAEHKIKLSRRNISYLADTPYLREYEPDTLKAVAFWNQLFGEVESLRI